MKIVLVGICHGTGSVPDVIQEVLDFVRKSEIFPLSVQVVIPSCWLVEVRIFAENVPNVFPEKWYYTLM